MKVALRVIRVALIAGAIALAIFAQRTIQNLSLGAQTLPLFAAAIGLLFVSSIGVQAAPRLRRADDEAPAFETLSRGQSLLWLASALFMVAGIVFFTRGAMNASGTAWLLHGAGMLLFALAFLPFQDVLTRFRRWRKAPEIVVDPEAILAVLLFVVVVGLALWLRTQALGDFPEGVWYDEGANGLVARQILDDPGYRPVYVDITQLPAHWDYVIAATLRLFGDNIGGLRMAPALFGVVAVAFLFLLLRRWFNTPLAFLGAACLAVMRYSLTFSRFGLNGMPSVTFEIMTLYFLDRAVRGRRLSDFALAGLTLGMGLNFYYAFRIFAGVVVGFGVLWVLWLLIRRVVFRRGSAARPDARGALRAWSVPLLIAVFGIAVAISPIAQFGVRFPAQFFQRTSTVSIFEKRDEPDLVKALTGNITKHLLMFNVRGDGNGRHNLPGEPMLDPLMAALAALGFGYALLNIRNPRNLFMVLTFLGMLAGGILSIDFEAPQAYRSIGVLAALPYFIILPLGALKEALGALFTGLPARRVAQGLVYAAGLAGVVVAGQANVTAFFDRQRYATDTWLPQSTPETFAAREMVRLAPNFDLVVSTQFAGHPSVRFEAPDAKNYKIFSANDLLLPAFTPGRGVAYLLDLSLTPAYEQLRRYFPNAETRLLTPPRGGGPYAYSVAISPEDILAALGARASLFPGGRFDAAPAQTLDTPTLSANWATAAPVEGAFGAELNTTLNAPRAANYRFAVNGGEGGQVFVDGFPVPAAGLDLAEGNHALRVRLPNARTAFEVTWLIGNNGGFQPIPQSALLRPPITNSGLQGSYFRSPDWTGAPAIRRLDPTIAFYFHNIPLPRPYTVRWEGKVFAPVPGTYRFTTQSIDESLLEIDGKTVIENRGTNQRVDGTLTLTTGWHDIVLRFADRTSYTQVYLYWAPPGGAYEIIPSNVLRPPMGEYPSVEAMQALLAEAAKPAPAGSVKQVTAAAASEGLPRLRPPELAPTAAAPPPAPTAAPGAASAPAPAAAEPGAIAPLPALPPLGFVPLKVVGGEGDGPGQFKAPRGVAVDKRGRVLVADAGNHRVQVLDGEGAFQREITGGSKPFADPVQVAVTSAGEVLVLDAETGLLSRFSADLAFVGEINVASLGLVKARGLFVAADDTLILADASGRKFVAASLSGDVRATVTAPAKGSFGELSAVARNGAGSYFVGDGQQGVIRVLNADGTTINDISFARVDASVGVQFAALPDNGMLATLPEPHKLIRIDARGKPTGEFGGFGVDQGQFRLPTGIAISGDTVWVVETGNHRLQKLRIK